MTYKNKQGIKAIFFDMDGTITRPHIDWKALRDRVGVPPGVPIMAHLEALPEPEKTRAETVLCDVEYEAAESAEPNPGVAELFDYLSRQPLDLADHLVQFSDQTRWSIDLPVSVHQGPVIPERPFEFAAETLEYVQAHLREFGQNPVGSKNSSAQCFRLFLASFLPRFLHCA